MNYEVDIPLKPLYIRMIAEAIPNAYYLYDEHVNEQNFLTDNGRDGEIWNYIIRGFTCRFFSNCSNE